MVHVEDVLNHEYIVNQKWAVRKMAQSHGSDKSLAYIHGFNSGVELLCAKAEFSNPAIAEGVRELASGMTDENTEALRSLMNTQNETIVAFASPSLDPSNLPPERASEDRGVPVANPE